MSGGDTAPRDRDGYLIKSLVHAADILRAFERRGELLSLRDVMDRTGYGKGMCFRLLHTLRHLGFVERVDRRYQLAIEVPRPRTFRLGYAAQGHDSSFASEVHDGLVTAAARERVELRIVDNRYNAKTALKNAEQLIRDRVDLVIEFQTDEAAAPEIASRYRQAGIPVIAIDIPHPGATYFGANNYEAGLMAGRCLARWAKQHWRGRVDEILLIDIVRAGTLPASRTRGVLAGIREILRTSASVPVVTIDGDGQFKTALERVRRHLRTSRATHVLVGAANDPSALGAGRAFQEAGRAASCAIVGQNAEPDARAELRAAHSPLVASVAYFPEKYGDGLIRLAIDLLAQRRVPPAVFVTHELVTPANVDHVYPNDALLGVRTFARF
ncbi:MAG: LacI family transcriptional regulator [Acidobacteria bacterium SCN 69-37]|nr:MAG: LacI family transcriptional regulator [Acidobacteria bacterium SCN 69-37]